MATFTAIISSTFDGLPITAQALRGTTSLASAVNATPATVGLVRTASATIDLSGAGAGEVEVVFADATGQVAQSLAATIDGSGDIVSGDGVIAVISRFASGTNVVARVSMTNGETIASASRTLEVNGVADIPTTIGGSDNPTQDFNIGTLGDIVQGSIGITDSAGNNAGFDIDYRADFLGLDPTIGNEAIKTAAGSGGGAVLPAVVAKIPKGNRIRLTNRSSGVMSDRPRLYGAPGETHRYLVSLGAQGSDGDGVNGFSEPTTTDSEVAQVVANESGADGQHWGAASDGVVFTLYFSPTATVGATATIGLEITPEPGTLLRPAFVAEVIDRTAGA